MKKPQTYSIDEQIIEKLGRIDQIAQDRATDDDIPLKRGERGFKSSIVNYCIAQTLDIVRERIREEGIEFLLNR